MNKDLATEDFGKVSGRNLEWVREDGAAGVLVG